MCGLREPLTHLFDVRRELREIVCHVKPPWFGLNSTIPASAR